MKEKEVLIFEEEKEKESKTAFSFFNICILLSVGLLIVFIDQGTKQIALTFLELHKPKPVIDGVLSFTLVFNKGIAFGILAGFKNPLVSKVLAVTIVCALIMLIIVGVRYYSDSFLGLMAVTFIFFGALGNVIDRIRHGYVVDFIDFYWKGYHWPAFNVADSAITVGILVLFFLPMGKGKNEEGENQ